MTLRLSSKKMRLDGLDHIFSETPTDESTAPHWMKRGLNGFDISHFKWIRILHSWKVFLRCDYEEAYSDEPSHCTTVPTTCDELPPVVYRDAAKTYACVITQSSLTPSLRSLSCRSRCILGRLTPGSLRQCIGCATRNAHLLLLLDYRTTDQPAPFILYSSSFVVQPSLLRYTFYALLPAV
jgi:hypothetical protein